MGKKSDFSIAVLLLILMIPLFFYMVKNIGWTAEEFEKNNDQGESNEQQVSTSDPNDKKDTEQSSNKDDSDKKDKETEKGQETEKQADDKIIWGVDSASPTTKELYTCIDEQYGKPEIWGRYLGTKEGVSQGITKEEIQYLHKQEAKILSIYNHFNSAKGYDHGLEMAKQAISLAKEVELPKGKAIFADIEPDYPVNASFIQGWFDGIKGSSYQPGVYGVFAEEQALFKEYEQAIKTQTEIKEEMIVWSAHPQVETTTKDQAPDYEPTGPKGSLILGWQYGIEAKSCNIDTNLFKEEIKEYLW